MAFLLEDRISTKRPGDREESPQGGVCPSPVVGAAGGPWGLLGRGCCHLAAAWPVCVFGGVCVCAYVCGVCVCGVCVCVGVCVCTRAAPPFQAWGPVWGWPSPGSYSHAFLAQERGQLKGMGANNVMLFSRTV